MQPTAFVFEDAIAQTYDDYLGPFAFEPFAADLAGRATTAPAANVLELACGTGRVTRHLAAHLTPPAQLTATDLNPGMLAVAQRKILAPHVAWDVVDMTRIPYADEAFGLVVCQFGVMFAPDKPRVLREMHRVLVPGGRLLFNTWADVADNQLFALANAVAAAYFGSNPGAGPGAVFDAGRGRYPAAAGAGGLRPRHGARGAEIGQRGKCRAGRQRLYSGHSLANGHSAARPGLAARDASDTRSRVPPPPRRPSLAVVAPRLGIRGQ